MLSAHAAKRQANSHLHAEGSPLVALHATRSKKHGVWVVGYRDPGRPDEMLVGGALVVTDEGEVYEIGSTPDAVDLLMDSLPRPPAWKDEETVSREGERRWSGSVDSSWRDSLAEQFSGGYFGDLMRFINSERRAGAVYPPAAEMFAAFQLTPYDEVKVVVLGQDPYHQPGQANGLCFSVPRDVLRLPPSLRNIFVAMGTDGLTPPPHGDLSHWARQGVLLLNTALTVRESEANSHANCWRWFTDAVISKLSQSQRTIVFVLWGKAAQRKLALIDQERHEVLTAPHPAARGRLQAEFRQAGTFAEVNRRLETNGLPPIDWSAS